MVYHITNAVIDYYGSNAVEFRVDWWSPVEMYDFLMMAVLEVFVLGIACTGMKTRKLTTEGLSIVVLGDHRCS